jgi:hypothetical protein
MADSTATRPDPGKIAISFFVPKTVCKSSAVSSHTFMNSGSPGVIAGLIRAFSTLTGISVGPGVITNPVVFIGSSSVAVYLFSSRNPLQTSASATPIGFHDYTVQAGTDPMEGDG